MPSLMMATSKESMCVCVCVCADATRSLVDANTASASSFFSLSFCCLRIFYLGSGDELLFIGVVFSINKTKPNRHHCEW